MYALVYMCSHRLEISLFRSYFEVETTLFPRGSAPTGNTGTIYFPNNFTAFLPL